MAAISGRALLALVLLAACGHPPAPPIEDPTPEPAVSPPAPGEPGAQPAPEPVAAAGAQPPAPGEPAAEPPVQGPRLVTFALLRSEPEEPGTVHVKAYLVSANDPDPCPKKARCQPCVPTTLLADSPDDDLDHQVLVGGYPQKPKLIDKKTAYTFVLELEEGYSSNLEHKTCDPRVITIHYVDCLDCPKKKKKKK